MNNEQLKEMMALEQQRQLEMIDRALHLLIVQYKNGYEKNMKNHAIRNILESVETKIQICIDFLKSEE